MSIDAQECISSDIRMHTQISMRQQTKLDERKTKKQSMKTIEKITSKQKSKSKSRN